MRKRVCDGLQRLLRERLGTTSIEYAFIAVLIGIVLIASYISIGNSISTFFMSVGTGL